jgi:hypothetical protein
MRPSRKGVKLGRRTVNKTAEIREAARKMIAEGKPPRPIEIIESLANKGIHATSGQVSVALRGTGLMLKERSGPWETPVTTPSPLEAIKKVSIDQLKAAEQFTKTVGGQDIAIASIVALGCFRQEPHEEPEDYYGGA